MPIHQLLPVTCRFGCRFVRLLHQTYGFRSWRSRGDLDRRDSALVFVQLHRCFLCAGMIRGPTTGCAKPLFSSRIPRDVQVLGHFQNLHKQRPALRRRRVPKLTRMSGPIQAGGVSCLRCSLAMSRRRGNPKWGSGGQPLQPTRAAATEFEVQVRQLRLTQQTCAGSRELRTWCERNRNRYYIPEWLLKAWEMPVDPDSSH